VVVRRPAAAGQTARVAARDLERWHLKARACYIPGTIHAYLVGMEPRQPLPGRRCNRQT